MQSRLLRQPVTRYTTWFGRMLYRNVHRAVFRAVFVVALLGLFGSDLSFAQTGAEQSGAGGDPSIEKDLARLRELVDAAVVNLGKEAGDEQNESELAASYRQIEQRLDIAAIAVSNAESSRQFIQESPELLRKLRQQLAGLRNQDDGAVKPDGADPGVSIEQMQSALTTLRATRASLDNTAVELERELNNFESRPLSARTELSEYREKAVEAVVSDRAGGDTELARLSTEVESLIVRANIDVLEQELLANSTRVAVLKLRQQVTEQRQKKTQTEIETAERQLSARRQQRARDVDTDIAREQDRASQMHALAKTVYEQNKVYAKDLIRVESMVRNASSGLTLLAKGREKQFQNFKSARERLEAAGNTGAMIDLLNFQRRTSPLMAEQRTKSAERQQRISNAGVEHFKVIDRLNDLTDIDSAMSGIMDSHTLSDSEQSDLRSEIVRQLDILESLDATYTRYLDTLSATEFESKEFANETDVYQRFLDERLLWVPNTGVVAIGSAPALVTSVLWLLQPARWNQLLLTAIRTASINWIKFLAAVTVVLMLLYKRRSLIDSIKRTNRDIASVRTDRFRHTLSAFVSTLLLVLPLPLTLFSLGWFLSIAVSTDGFPEALGQGLLVIAPMVFVLRFVSAMCRPASIANQHFRWGGEAAAFLKNNLVWFAPLYVVARLTWISADANSRAVDPSEMVRVAALISLGALGWFVYRVFGPSRPLLAPLFSGGSRVWTMRLSYIWFPVLVVTPVVMIVLVLSGYLYTASELLMRLEYSLFLIVAVFTVESLLIRGLNVAQRQLAFRRAKAKWEARSNAEGETSAEGSPVTLADAEIDIATVDSQSRQFIRTLQTLALIVGLWLIWSRLLPFFGNVTDIDLWRSSSVDASGANIAVNLRDIVLACVISFLAWFAARNLPALLEIAILQRLQLDPGSRYAIGRIVQYTIATVGILYVFSFLGISWSKVQWLVAALGVGIGFGLQEIFANFISGLIILFERPVRLGDTITIGELSGTVSRIRLRTTTIIDWDSKEIVVPNKHLITDRLTNWTLSDATTRVVICFGVAYGSDIEQTFDLVKGVAEKHPSVLENPPLQLFLLAFGASSLDFELRVYVSQLSERLPVTHDLLIAIEKTLSENDIEIPYPQHEVRIRDSSNLPIPALKLQDEAIS